MSVVLLLHPGYCPNWGRTNTYYRWHNATYSHLTPSKVTSLYSPWPQRDTKGNDDLNLYSIRFEQLSIPPFLTQTVLPLLPHTVLYSSVSIELKKLRAKKAAGPDGISLHRWTGRTIGACLQPDPHAEAGTIAVEDLLCGTSAQNKIQCSFRPEDLTSHLMETLEILVLGHLCSMGALPWTLWSTSYSGGHPHLPARACSLSPGELLPRPAPGCSPGQ